MNLMELERLKIEDTEEMAVRDDVAMRRKLRDKAKNSLNGFNVIIVCCSSSLQANYWQKRLENGKGTVLPRDAFIISVEEDWPGGAGNGNAIIYLCK